MSSHVFVDETKDRDYLLVAIVVPAGDLDSTRTAIRGLVLHGQHRVHMKKESDSRRDRLVLGQGWGLAATYPTSRDRDPVGLTEI